jgi:murein DD-endopeptidase MepM/ murein hydrolase activator NlpD
MNNLSSGFRPRNPWALLALLLASFTLTFLPFPLSAQSVRPGGGAYEPEPTQCLSPADHAAIQAEANANAAELQGRGLLQTTPTESLVSFIWPMKLKAGLTDPSYYGISNYVDENAGAGLLDYNCGNRTYEGHKGTDIFLWPFPWTKVANNEVEVIAGAAGTIVAKHDGNFDLQCAWVDGAQGNGIILQHADGSRSWYWHLKKNALTAKGLGAAVAAGEYLGVVASSGISTGPHLHFEVYNPAGQLVDPWGGTCNGLGGQSWWAGQKPYRDPRVNRLATHSALPQMPQCPSETLHLSNQFQPGQTVYFAAYYRDQMVNSVSNYAVIQPNGAVWQSWSATSNQTYTASWWHWNFQLPATAPTGTWKFQVTFNGQTTVHNFTVGSCSSPATTQIFVSNVTSTSVRLNCSVAGVSAYDWRYRATAASSWTDLPSTTANFVDISGLTPGTAYEFQAGVRCTNNVWSNWSGSKLFITPAASLCTGALAITCGGQASGTTAGGTNSLSSYGCSTWPETGPERIYKLVLTSGGTFTATLSNLTADLDVFVLNACNSAGCVAFGENAATVTNAPAGTYYIVVDGYQGVAGNFTLSVSCPAETGNNEPCGATQLPAGAGCTFQTLTTAGATATTNPAPPNLAGCPTTGIKDIWVKLIMPATGKVLITTTAGTLSDIVVAAYSGTSCSALSMFGCIDDNASNADPMPDITVTSAAGSTVWLRIWGYNGATGTFNICVQTVTALEGNADAEVEELTAFEPEAENRSEEAPTDQAGSTARLELYPVPATDWLQVELRVESPEETAEATIVDMHGNVLRRFDGLAGGAGGFSARLGLEGLPAGAYALVLRCGAAVHAGRFVKL